MVIARTLTLNPRTSLSDEAISASDLDTTKSILGLITEINAEFGATVVLITYEMDIVGDVAQRALLLEHG